MLELFLLLLVCCILVSIITNHHTVSAEFHVCDASPKTSLTLNSNFIGCDGSSHTGDVFSYTADSDDVRIKVCPTDGKSGSASDPDYSYIASVRYTTYYNCVNNRNFCYDSSVPDGDCFVVSLDRSGTYYFQVTGSGTAHVKRDSDSSAGVIIGVTIGIIIVIVIVTGACCAFFFMRRLRYQRSLREAKNASQNTVQVCYVQSPAQVVDPMQQAQMQQAQMQQMQMQQMQMQQMQMQQMQQMNMMQPMPMTAQGQMMQPVNTAPEVNETDCPAQAAVYQSGQPPSQPQA